MSYRPHRTQRAGRASRSSKAAPVFSNGNDIGRNMPRALVACLALAPTFSSAAPLVFEETAKITAPDPSFHTFPAESIAVEGDTIIATGRKSEDDIQTNAAFLFQRQSNGNWAYVTTLAQNSCDSGEVSEDTCNAAVAIRNGLAVVVAGEVHVFERSTNGAWVAAPTEGFSGPGDAAVGSDTVLISESNECAWESRAFRKDSSGVWRVAATFPGPSSDCHPWGHYGSDVDISAGNRVIVGASFLERRAYIYEPTSTGWTQTAALDAHRRDRVAIDDARAFISGTDSVPIRVLTRDTGGWVHATDIVPPDSARLFQPSAIAVRDLVVAAFGSDPHRNGSVGLFRATSASRYEQVGRLVRSDSAEEDLSLGSYGVDADVTGSSARIVAGARGALYVYDLDQWGTTPAPLQETFELGNAANWTPLAGSSFSVVTSSGTRVYRQTSVAGGAGSFVSNIDWTNQAIEADVRPTAFNGADRWVGLVVRRTDEDNYYYLTLRQTNVLQIRRMVNGSFVTLASIPMPLSLNRTYRLRLEAIGTLIRAYVDGQLAVEAHDAELTHGHPGVRMYKARADFDNVVVSHNPHLTLVDDHTISFLDSSIDLWALEGGAWSLQPEGGKQRVRQQDVSGGARAVTRVSATDQIVQARVSPTSFAGGTGSRWFGLVARYRDDGNYYYVTARADNTISLRKLVNGTIQVLDTAPLTVSAGTSYMLRLEAIGSSLRAYVNGRVVLEANDSSYPTGRYGLATYKTAATFDDFVAWEP